jgi:hypothetical protein
VTDWPRDPDTGRVVLGAAIGRTTFEETVKRCDARLDDWRHVLALLEARLEAGRHRRHAHAEHLARTARTLGRLMARHDVTRAQVERRLHALIYAHDPEPEELVEVRLLDPAECRRIAEAALALGMQEARS